MKNKKGFTLVELLAVIVILAVIILIAVNAVLPQMNRARKNSFADEAMNYLKAAETKYVEGALDPSTESGDTVTFNVDGDLNQKYVSKSGYKGQVQLTLDEGGNVTAKKIWLTDCKNYMVVGKPTSGTKIDGQTDVVKYTAATWNAVEGLDSNEQCSTSSSSSNSSNTTQP